MNKINTQNWEERFDKKFAKISNLNRGEFVITDLSGSSFQAHTENGKVTQIGGLESIKDFIAQERILAQQSLLQAIRDRQYSIGFEYEVVSMKDINTIAKERGL